MAKINVKAISAYWYQKGIKKQNEIMLSYLQDFVHQLYLLSSERNFRETALRYDKQSFWKGINEWSDW